MPDMLVKLYDLPPSNALKQVQTKHINIRPALTPEKQLLCQWVRDNFTNSWADEVDVAMTRQPVSVFVAILDSQFVGFACYDTTARGFFGPTGVDEKQRGQGIGEALLFECLQNMRAIGYGYAIIGWAGPVDFYRQKVNATVIENSEPGIYKNLVSK